MTTIQSKYVVSVDSNATCGAITWYSLSGGADVATLRANWAAQGLDPAWLPEDPTPFAALAAAVHDAAGSLARPIGGRRGGWQVFRESKALDGQGRRLLEHSHALRAWIIDGQLHVEGDTAICDQVRTNYAFYLTHWTAADLSVLMVDTLHKLQAVTLRERGGNYFVPKEGLDTAAKVRDALTPKHIRLYLVPALTGEETVTAVLDALTNEVTSTAQSVFENLADNALGVRALKTRQGNVSKLLQKTLAYEGLLGDKINVLRDKLGDLEAALTTAVFQVEAAEAKAAS